MARSSLISPRRPVNNNMLSTKTTAPRGEGDLSALQSDIRLMEIADDPAQFSNFLPGHLRGNATQATTSFTQPVGNIRSSVVEGTSPSGCEHNSPDEQRVLEDDEEYRSMMRRFGVHVSF